MSDDQNRDDEQARREYIRATFGNDALEAWPPTSQPDPSARARPRSMPRPGPMP